ncbi:MAG: 3-dehydroquinate synthase [Bacteroidales bacterium]|nr:3-dehydroquinate synthase [Bacteroidales bacterium]
MTLRCQIPGAAYSIHIGRGILSDAGKLFNLGRKVLIVTDEGVPCQYAQAVLASCPDGSILTVPGGEGGKSLSGAELILKALLDRGFTRADAVVAVGGGVVGDMAGFAAACYMRGIEYYNVPTTLLSQVDSSVGGKTAVNLGGVKNIVGAFHQPSGVLIDVDTLDTLSPRLFAEGMAELVKMAATCGAALFERIERSADVRAQIESFISDALRIKISVVEQDPEEKGLRAVLNFGHTVGHAIEAAGKGEFYHGECVAMGMPYMSSSPARERLEALLQRLGLPVRDPFGAQELMALAASDKKKSASGFKTVQVDNIGSFSFKTLSAGELLQAIQNRKQQ